MSQGGKRRTPGKPGSGSIPRAGSRARLPIPVTARIGAAPSRQTRLHDVSVSGCRIDWPEPVEPGEPAIIRFAGYPGVCPAFILHCRVVRVVDDGLPGLGIAIDRGESPAEALNHLRQLVLHYMRHKPLLDEIERDFSEGRCEACGWIGRVGTRAPNCPRCGGRVRALDPGQ